MPPEECCFFALWVGRLQAVHNRMSRPSIPWIPLQTLLSPILSPTPPSPPPAALDSFLITLGKAWSQTTDGLTGTHGFVALLLLACLGVAILESEGRPGFPRKRISVIEVVHSRRQSASLPNPSAPTPTRTSQSPRAPRAPMSPPRRRSSASKTAATTAPKSNRPSTSTRSKRELRSLK